MTDKSEKETKIKNKNDLNIFRASLRKIKIDINQHTDKCDEKYNILKNKIRTIFKIFRI